MWRSFFMAVAISVIILGAECLVLNRVVLTKQVVASDPRPGLEEYWGDPLLSSGPQIVNRTVVPPEWAPWSLLSAGAVMMLYAISLRRAE